MDGRRHDGYLSGIPVPVHGIDRGHVRSPPTCRSVHERTDLDVTATDLSALIIGTLQAHAPPQPTSNGTRSLNRSFEASLPPGPRPRGWVVGGVVDEGASDGGG